MHLVAELDFKLAALKREPYANFTATMVGVPVSKLWDLLEAAFRGSDSEDEVEVED